MTDAKRLPLERGLGYLLGNRVKTILVSPDQEELVFRLHNGCDVVLITTADCCSETWFADIIGVSSLLNEFITGVNILPDTDPEDDRSRQCYDTAYGFTLSTQKGVTTIAYRNSSNGYYGGDCIALVTENYDRDNLRGFKQITEDWSA
jgi:hypothetical protein